MFVGREERVQRAAYPTSNGLKIRLRHRLAQEVLASHLVERSRFLKARGEPLQLLRSMNWVGRSEPPLPLGPLCLGGPTERLGPILQVVGPQVADPRGGRKRVPALFSRLSEKRGNPGGREARLSSRTLELPIRTAPDESITVLGLRFAFLVGIVFVGAELEAELPLAGAEKTDFAENTE